MCMCVFSLSFVTLGKFVTHQHIHTHHIQQDDDKRYKDDVMSIPYSRSIHATPHVILVRLSHRRDSKTGQGP